MKKKRTKAATSTRKASEFVSFSMVKARALKDSAVRREYEALEPEFQLARAILKARERQGITQQELARRVGTSQSAIARFEAGAGNPTLSFVSRISEALGTHLSISVK